MPVIQRNVNRKFIIEKVLDRRFHAGEKQYLIQWKGYPGNYNSWEPVHALEVIEGWLLDYDRVEEEKQKNEELKATMEEERKKTQELEEKLRSLSTPSADGNKRGLEASASSNDGAHEKQARKKKKLNEQEVPHAVTDAQLMTNDEDHDNLTNVPENGITLKTTLATESGSETGTHALSEQYSGQSDWTDGEELVMKDLTNENEVNLKNMPVLAPCSSSTENEIEQVDHNNLPPAEDGITANASFKQEISNLKAEINQKDNVIKDLTVALADAKDDISSLIDENSMMSNKLTETENELNVAQKEMEKKVLVRDSRITLLEAKKMRMNSFKALKLAKSETLLRRTRTKLNHLKVKHNIEIQAFMMRNSMLERQMAGLTLTAAKYDMDALTQKNSELQTKNADLEKLLAAAKQDVIRLGNSLAADKEKNEQLYESVDTLTSETEVSPEQNVELEEKFGTLDAKCDELLEIIQATNPEHDCKYKGMLTEIESKQANTQN